MSNLFDSIKIYEESFENQEDINSDDTNFDEEMDLNLILKDLAKHYHISNIYKQSEVLFCFYKSTIHLKSFYESCFTNQEIQNLIYQEKIIFPSLESINEPLFNIIFLKNNIQEIKMSISVPENLDKIEYECSIVESMIQPIYLGYDNLSSSTFLNHIDVIVEILNISSILHNVNIITQI